MDIKLNKEQLAAVKHKGGALLIVAGAGTGKTTVITERIKYLISEGLAKSSEILALTFTEKAATEMEERIDIAMPYGYTQMWISTFHSFCDRVLRQEGLAIGIDTSYKLMTTVETKKLIKDNIFDFDFDYFRPLGNPNKFINGLLQHFGRLQDEDIGPKQYLAWVNGKWKMENERYGEEDKFEKKKFEELSKAYKFYADLKTKEGVMDFGDLIIKTLELFRKRPNILKEYQRKFKYILVDEYQDTNIAQNELVKLLSADDGNITVVLDDDQSIYRFRGAAASNAIQFRNSFPKAKIVTLIKNYRSGQKILDAAYDLIQHNNPDRLEIVEKIDKKLVSEFSKNGEVELIHKYKVEDEVEEVAQKIASIVSNISNPQVNIESLKAESDTLSFKDIAILVRANNHAEPFISALKRRGIPHQFLGPAKLFQQSEIREIVLFLKVLVDMEDSVSFLGLLENDIFEISNADLIYLSNKARKTNTTLYDICKMAEEFPLSDKTKEKIAEILSLLHKYMDMTKDRSAGELVYLFLEDTKLLSKYLNPDTQDAQKKAENISYFFDKVKNYEMTHSDAKVTAIVDWIGLMQEEGESPLVTNSDWNSNDAVNIMTIHSSKGLEFPVVFMVNLIQGRFPSINRSEQIPIPDELVKEVLPSGDANIQEERRLFYVGMTRAKEKLYLSAADYYGEAKRQSKLSPFIFEALGEDAVSAEQKNVNNSNQLSFLDYTASKKEEMANGKWQMGDLVPVDCLSYSQIQTFKECPLHYKLKYILRIPTPPSAALTFGNTIHATMNDFYAQVKAGNEPSEKVLLDIYSSNWVNEGFAHKKQENDYRIRGEKYLKEYLKKSFSKERVPLALEKPFLITLHSKSKGSRLKIRGKIDRIDLISAQAHKRKIEIIDYKTGENVPTQKEVDKNDQLTFYALAVSKMENEIGEVNDVSLALYYFEEQIKIVTKRTKEQLVSFQEKLFDVKNEIENSDFSCSGSFYCKSCDFINMCQSNF